MAYYTKITDIGRAKIAAAIAGDAVLQVVAMALGDGGGNPVPEPTGQETGLVREVLRKPLNRFERIQGLEEIVEAEALIASDQGGFTVRELTLIDVDGDTIAYGNYPPVYKPRPEESTPQDLGIRTSIEVATSAMVQLLIDPNIVTATRAWVSNQVHQANHVPEGGSLGQVLKKTGNGDKDYAWQDPAEVTVFVNAIEEGQVLADQQTTVTLQTVTTTGTAYYVNRQRLQPGDYETVSETEITLAQSYPANSVFLAVQNEPNAEIRADNVPVAPIDALPGIQTVQAALEAMGVAVLQPGDVKFTASPDPQAGFILVENGREVKKSDYPRLYAAIGDTWGQATDPDSFKLPPIADRYIRIEGGDHQLGDLLDDQNKKHTHAATMQEAGDHAHSGKTSKSGAHKHEGGIKEKWNGRIEGYTGKAPGNDNFAPSQTDEGLDFGYGIHEHNLIINANGKHKHQVSLLEQGGNEARPKTAVLRAWIKT